MPLFQLKCQNCGYQTEELFKNYEAMLVNLRNIQCPKCKQFGVFKREYTPALEIFKCNGFYKTEHN